MGIMVGFFDNKKTDYLIILLDNFYKITKILNLCNGVEFCLMPKNFLMLFGGVYG